jgi:ATP-dependent DNA helicase DinG
MSQDGCRRSRLIAFDAARLGNAIAALFPPDSHAPRRRDLLLTPQSLSCDAWTAARAMLLDLRAHLSELASWLSLLPDVLPRLRLENPGLAHDALGALEECEELLAYASELASPSSDGRARIASIHSARNGWSLRSEPLDVAEGFARIARGRAVGLSSPSLAVGAPMPWVMERLGLPGRCERISSAADGIDLKARRPLVLLVTDAPSPYDDAFLNWATNRIGGIASFLGGRVIGLFSSHARLLNVEERLRPHLERFGIEVVRASQALRTSPPNVAATAGRVLLGSRALWHRGEVSHDAACVFIDKLPIEPLAHGAIAAREADASRSSVDLRYGGMPYRLPKALVLLRHWLATGARAGNGQSVVIVASPGHPQHREALLAALDGYRQEVGPWSIARLRIFEALRPLDGRFDRGAPAALASA